MLFNAEQSISEDHQEPGQELTRPQRVHDLPGPKFLAARDIFQKITEKEHIIENCSPGDKSNCWFLMDNGDNTNTSDRKRSYDDCGVWDNSKGRCHDQPYHLTDNFKTIFLKNKEYCTRQRIKGKAVFIPIDPPPVPEEIVTMHRYETALKANPEFKKHVSWFASTTDGSLHTTALYEYLGAYDLSASENVRTNPKVIDKLKTDTRKPKQMYTDMNLNNSLEAPKNTKQIKNAKYIEKKMTTQPTNNIADEILAVINMTNNHPYMVEQ